MPELSTTVVIPVFNGASIIDRALRSVARQSLPVDEVIVVDDGSTDGLVAALHDADFRGRLIQQANAGQGAATNRGIDACESTHVLFLDHDDEWAEDRLAWQIEVMHRTNCDIVIGGVTNVTVQADGPPSVVDMGPARVLGAGLFRREVFNRVGPLPEDRRIHEIFDWWSRAEGLVTVAQDPRPALFRHIHGGNMTMQSRHRDRADLLARLREHVHRQGRGGDADR